MSVSSYESGSSPTATLGVATTVLPLRNNVKILSKDDQGRLFLKVFLLDETVNGNQWGVDPSTVDQNIKTAIGKPLVLYRDTGQEPDRSWYPRIPGLYNHPPWDDADISHTYEMQEQYRVGDIIDVVKNQETGAWWGVVEVTNDGVRKALDENPTLPFYVSPSIRRLHTQQANQTIKDWVFMHSAIVSIPAFGVQKAYSSGRCAGDKDTCILQFMHASLQQNRAAGTADCGFCTYQAMLEIEEQIALDAVLGQSTEELEEDEKFDGGEEEEEDSPIGEETFTAAAARRKKKMGPHAATRPDRQFAYVPQEAKGRDGKKSARKFPIFDAAHVRNALARFSQASLPSGQKSAVLAKICRAARRFGVDSEVCSSKGGSKKSSSNAALTMTASLNNNSTNNNLNTSHVTISANSPLRQSLSDPNTTTNTFENVAVPNAATVSETVATAAAEGNTAATTTPQQQPTKQSSAYTANTNKDSGSSGEQQLVDLLVQNERRQKQLQAAYHEINKLARDNQKLAQESSTSTSRLAAMEKYIGEQQRLAREDAITEIVYSAGLAEFVPDEQKEEQIRLLMDSPYSIEDIQKLTAPWYSAFDSFLTAQQQKGDVAIQHNNHQAQVPQSTRIAASQNVRLPLRGPARRGDVNTKTASQLPSSSSPPTSSQATTNSRTVSNKPAFLEIRELMGIVDSNQGGGAY